MKTTSEKKKLKFFWRRIFRWRERVIFHLNGHSSEEQDQLTVNKVILQLLILWKIHQICKSESEFLEFIRTKHSDKKEKIRASCHCIGNELISYLRYLQQPVKNNLDGSILLTVQKTRNILTARCFEFILLKRSEIRILGRIPCFFFINSKEFIPKESLKGKRSSQAMDFVPFFEILEALKYDSVDFDGYLLGTMLEMLTKRDERRRKGTYYTPRPIVARMVIKTLAYYLARQEVINTPREMDLTVVDLCKAIPDDRIQNAIHSLLKVKILDPAVGSGHFLEMMVTTWLDLIVLLWKRWNQMNENSSSSNYYHWEKELDSSIQSLLSIQSERHLRLSLLVEHFLPLNLYGIDLEEIAVKFARFRLLIPLVELLVCDITGKDKEKSIILQDLKIEMGNALISDIPKRKGSSSSFDISNIKFINDHRRSSGIFPFQDEFDIVIGNPPYGRSILTSEEKRKLLNCYQILNQAVTPKKRSFNAAALFIEKALQIARPGAIIGFILPNSLTRVEEFEMIREHMMRHALIKEIIDEGNPFEGVTLEMVTIIMQKKRTHDHYLEKQREIVIFSKRNDRYSMISRINLVDPKIFSKYKRFMLYVDDLFYLLTEDALFEVIMGDYGLDHRRVNKDLHSSRDEIHVVPFLHSGKSVKKYHLVEMHFHWSRSYEEGRFQKLMKETSIVTTAIATHPRAALKPPGLIPGTNVSVQQINNCPKLRLKTAIVILNSQLIGYYLHRYVLNFSRLTIYLHKYYTKMIPIKIPQNQKIFEILHDYLLTLGMITGLTVPEHLKQISDDLRLNQQMMIKMQVFFREVVAETLVLETYLAEFLQNYGLDLLGNFVTTRELQPLPKIDFTSWVRFKRSFYDINAMKERLKIIVGVYHELINSPLFIHLKTLKKVLGNLSPMNTLSFAKKF